jgi:DNA-directed RNA polymerase specialized sigma24 family protein
MGGVMYRERTKQDRYETPVGVRYNDAGSKARNGSLSETDTLWDAHRHPENEYEALMQPGDMPDAETLEVAWGEYEQKIAAAGLTAEEQEVFDMMVFGGHSLAWCANHLGCSKTWVAKLKKRALVKLQEAFDATV